MDVVEMIARLMRPLHNRVELMLSRGVVKLSDDSKGFQLLQVSLLTDEVRGDLERFQQYGFSARPKNGAEAVVLFLGGHRDHGVVVAVDDRKDRPRDLEPGEACMWSPGGARIFLHADGTIEIQSPGVVTVNAASARVLCDLQVDGQIRATGDVIDATGSMQIMRQDYNIHTHAEHDGGSTAPPLPPME